VCPSTSFPHLFPRISGTYACLPHRLSHRSRGCSSPLAFLLVFRIRSQTYGRRPRTIYMHTPRRSLYDTINHPRASPLFTIPCVVFHPPVPCPALGSSPPSTVALYISSPFPSGFRSAFDPVPTRPAFISVYLSLQKFNESRSSAYFQLDSSCARRAFTSSGVQQRKLRVTYAPKFYNKINILFSASFAHFACGLVVAPLPRLRGATFTLQRPSRRQRSQVSNQAFSNPISTGLLTRSRSIFSTPISRCVFYRSALCYNIILPLISSPFAAVRLLRLLRSVPFETRDNIPKLARCSLYRSPPSDYHLRNTLQVNMV
jgi:hypothetical protein